MCETIYSKENEEVIQSTNKGPLIVFFLITETEEQKERKEERHISL